jgi:acyl-CoA dehydrogenase
MGAMMDTALSTPFGDAHADLIAETRRVAREQLAPIAHAGTPGRLNRPLLRALGELGLLGRLFSERVSALDLCLLREALARESTEAETALALQGLGTYPILQSGRPEVIERWLPAVRSGEAVSAFALTEPDAGSDAAALSLRAVRADGGWRLTGTKKWISNAPEADVYTVFARTTEGAGAKGVTAFVVPGNAPGLSGVPLELLAPHPIGQIDLDGVFVPAEHVLGDVDAGFRVAMRTLDMFRPSVGAFAVGMAQAALDAAVAYAGERQSFGKPLREHQAISQKLGDMATRTQAARLLVHAAAAAYDAGDARITQRSAMAKLFATEAAQQVIDDAIQIHGAVALQQGHLLEHLFRDVRAVRVYEGTSEIQREIIARELYRQPR